MITKELIKKKRNKEVLSKNEISWLIGGITDNTLTDSQVSALAMVIFFNGMNIDERKNLTNSMIDSGINIKFNVSGPVVDKHSTGGIGDNVSLILAPLLASCGCYVPMISGRSLGHTGGTLDKLDSIKGYNTSVSEKEFINVVKKVGCAIIGQTKNIAPADRRLYKIRDATGTIESIDLIVSSILSKKLSINLDSLILDVKCGNGAFMEDKKSSVKLAKELSIMGNLLGCKTNAILTDMSQPLCSSVGNSLEVKASIEFLKNEYKNERLSKVVFALAGEVLLMMNMANDEKDANKLISKSLNSGKAAEIFEIMISFLGGNKRILDSYKKELPKSKLTEDIFLPNEGFIKKIDCKKIGYALIELGGGRKNENDFLDYSVGFDSFLSKGNQVSHDTPVCRIHSSSKDRLEIAKKIITNAFEISDSKPKEEDVILENLN